jgi:hypothetical protein
MNLQERMIVRETAADRLLRVIHINPLNTWFMPLAQGGWPFSEGTKEATSQFRSGGYTPEPVNEVTPTSLGAAEHGDETYELFKDYLADTTRLLTDEGRSAVYRVMKVAHPTLSTSTFYKVVRRWLEGGMVPLALSGRWVSKKQAIDTSNLESISLVQATKACQAQSLRLQQEGKPVTPRPDHVKSGAKRRRRVPANPTAYGVDRETLRLFQNFYNLLKTEPGTTIPGMYKRMRREAFSTVSPVGDISLWPQWSIPSQSQFTDWYYVLTSHRTRRIRIRGTHHYDLNERARPGQGVSAAYSAGLVGSADATIWNVELVSDLPGAELIGPPVVFRIRCKDTGELLGIGISLENASWMGMGTAIANCAEDKVAFCAKYGITIGPDDWPVRGVPSAIEADCGETDNKKPYRFIRRTKCELRNLPPARPDLKPGVESDFNTLQVWLNESTPGAIIKAYEDKTFQQWRLGARMTLKAFIRHLLLEELKRMHTPREGLALPARMTADGADSSPHSMYQWCVENNAGGMRLFAEDDVKLSVMETDNGSVTDQGLVFKQLRYLAPELDMAQALDYARRHGRRTLKIAYDPRLVNHAYILQGDPENPTGYTKCELNRRRPDQRDLWDKTFREADRLQTRQVDNNQGKRESTEDRIANWTRQQQENAQNFDKLVSTIREDSGQSARSLLKGRKQARDKAKDATSPDFALRIGEDAKPASEPAKVTNVTPITGTPSRRRGTGFAAMVQGMNDHQTPAGATND